MRQKPFRGVMMAVVVVIAMVAVGCGFADDRREAVGASVPPTIAKESERTVRPSVETTLLPPVSLPSESPAESMPPAPDQVGQMDQLAGDAETDSGLFEAVADIGPQCRDLTKLLIISKQVFDDGGARSRSLGLFRDQMLQILTQVQLLVEGYPAPVAGTDELVGEVGSVIAGVGAAGTERAFLEETLRILERHGAAVDEVFSSLTRSCQLPDDPEWIRPSAMVSDLFRGMIGTAAQ